MVYTTSSFSGMDLNTEAGRQSAVVTMTLMQMVADAYEGAQEIWDKNSQRGMVEGVSDPESCGPNEAQKAILEWLIHAKFLPPAPPTQVPTSAIEYPACEPNAIPSTTPRSKNILGLRLTTSPKSTGSTARLPQPPVSPLSPKKFLQKIRRKSTPKVSTLPQPSANIPLPTPSRSSTLPSPAQLKAQPFVRPRRFSYKKRIRALETIESNGIKSSDALSRPRTKPKPSPPHSNSKAIKLGPIDTDTLAQLGFYFPTSRSRPPFPAPKPIQIEKCTKDPEDEEHQPASEVTWWTLIVVTVLIHLFFTIVFLACVFVGLRRFVRRFLSSNEAE